MEEIFKNIGNPSWWFTGIFFGVLIPILIKRIPVFLGRLLRNRVAKMKRRIKNATFSSSLMNYEIAKNNALFLLFIFVFGLYVVWFTFGPLNELRKESLVAFIIVISPIYIFEFIWLIQDRLVLSAIKRNNKLRITKRSRQAKLARDAVTGAP